jgi:DNA-binding protein HU-beta
MNKTELIDIVAAKADVTKLQAGEVVGAVIEAITEAIAQGDSVQFIGFGTFSVQQREERTGRNPQTGKEMKIEAKKVVRFKAGAKLVSAANPEPELAPEPAPEPMKAAKAKKKAG